MTTAKAVDSARRTAILSRVKPTPKGCCHFCGHRVGGKGALWCAQWCADEYEKERLDLLEPKTVVFGVLKGGDVVPVISKTTHGSDDDSQLQTISTELLTYYQRLDRAARVLLTPTQIELIRAGTF